MNRRRRIAATAVVLAVVLPAAGIVARRGDTSPAPAVDVPSRMVAPDGVLDISTVSEGVAVEFHYAAGHLEEFRQLRCWCGCEAAFGHANLADCFVRADGKWEAHGAGCGVCIASAKVARERLEAGTAVADIADEIDRTYGPEPNLTKDRT